MDGNSRCAEYPTHDALPQLLGFVALVLALVVAWPALLVGFALRLLTGRCPRLGLALWLVSLVVAVVWTVQAQVPHAVLAQVTALHHLGLSRQRSLPILLPHLVPLWLDSLILAPLVALALTVIGMLRGKQAEEEIVLASEQSRVAQERRRAAVAARQVRRAPNSLISVASARDSSVVMRAMRRVQGWQHGLLEARRQVVLGAAVSGDLAPAGSAWRTRHGLSGGWVTIPAAELRLPGEIIGASGSGKTETALRLAAETVGALGWQVIYLDAKGDYATAARFLAAMRVAGVDRVIIRELVAIAEDELDEPVALLRRIRVLLNPLQDIRLPRIVGQDLHVHLLHLDGGCRWSRLAAAVRW